MTTNVLMVRHCPDIMIHSIASIFSLRLDVHNGDHHPQKRTKPAPEIVHVTSMCIIAYCSLVNMTIIIH
jgi:hypothetical protein